MDFQSQQLGSTKDLNKIHLRVWREPTSFAVELPMYLAFGKMTVQVLYSFSNWIVCFLPAEFENLIHSRCKLFARYLI